MSDQRYDFVDYSVVRMNETEFRGQGELMGR